MVGGGWWLVVGGWWLLGGGWWVAVGDWWLVVGGWWVWLRLHCIVSLRRSAVIATTIVKLTPNLRP